jgi:RecA-family ATPase
MNRPLRPPDYSTWPLDRQNEWVCANDPELARQIGLAPADERAPAVDDERAKRATAAHRAKLKTAAEFCSEYVPLSYAVEPLIRSRSLYTLTARTGAGKTALLVAIGLAVASGRPDILDAEVEQGRVAYLAFENPDDVRMRLMIAAFLLNVDVRDIAERRWPVPRYEARLVLSPPKP